GTRPGSPERSGSGVFSGSAPSAAGTSIVTAKHVTAVSAAVCRALRPCRAMIVPHTPASGDLAVERSRDHGPAQGSAPIARSHLRSGPVSTNARAARLPTAARVENESKHDVSSDEDSPTTIGIATAWSLHPSG